MSRGFAPAVLALCHDDYLAYLLIGQLCEGAYQPARV
jgi:hypothetical protein